MAGSPGVVWGCRESFVNQLPKTVLIKAPLPPPPGKTSNPFHWNSCYYFFFFFFLAEGQPGVEPGPQQWKPGILTTRPPGKSLGITFFLKDNATLVDVLLFQQHNLHKCVCACLILQHTKGILAKKVITFSISLYWCRHRWGEKVLMHFRTRDLCVLLFSVPAVLAFVPIRAALEI